MNSTEMRERRAALVADARKLVDAADADKREMSGEENEKYSRMMADVDALGNDIQKAERREKLDSVDAELRHTTGRKTATVKPATRDTFSDQDRKDAWRAWGLAKTDFADTSADAQFRGQSLGLNPANAAIDLRALSKGTANAGGYTVGSTMGNEIEKKLTYYNDLRNICRVFKTAKGDDYLWPQRDGSSGGASIVAEGADAGTTNQPLFGQVTLKAYKYVTDEVLISVELLQDSDFDLEAELNDYFGEQMAIIQEPHFLNGTNSSQPQGLVTGASVGVNLASGNAISFDNVIDLIHSVNRSYRKNGAFLTHDLTLAALKKVKDTTGQYIWSPSVQVGEPDRIFNYPVYISNQFTNYAGSYGDNKPLALFGDFKRFVIRDVTGSMQLVRRDETFARTGQVGFFLRQRSDARYVGHSGCIKSLNSYDAP